MALARASGYPAPMTEKNQSRGSSPQRRTPSRASSPSTGARLSGADAESFVLPIRKTNPLIYVGAVVVALGIIGAVVFSGSGTPSSSPDPEVKTSGDSTAPLTKEEQKERLEHLRKTQAALEAAAVEEKASGASTKAPSAPTSSPQEPVRAAPPPASNKQAVAPKSEPAQAETPPKKSGSSEQSKKKAADLDALGADITSALK